MYICTYSFKAKSITNFKSLLKKKKESSSSVYKAWVSLARVNPLTRQHAVQTFQKEPGFHRRTLIRKGTKPDFDENIVSLHSILEFTMHQIYYRISAIYLK